MTSPTGAAKAALRRPATLVRSFGMKPGQRTDREAWKEPFLAALAEHGVVAWAVETAGVARSTAYVAKGLDPEFATAWHDAERAGAEALEKVAHQYATGQLQRTREKLVANDEGELVVTERVTETIISPAVLIFLLKAKKPEVYRDRGWFGDPGVTGDEEMERTPMEEDWARIGANLTDEEADTLMDIFQRARDRSRAV